MGSSRIVEGIGSGVLGLGEVYNALNFFKMNSEKHSLVLLGSFLNYKLTLCFFLLFFKLECKQLDVQGEQG